MTQTTYMVRESNLAEMNSAEMNAAQNCETSLGKWLKKVLALCLVGTAMIAVPGQSVSAENTKKGSEKVLIVYFSRTGNTQEMATQIHQVVGGDLVEIKPAHSYPKEYRATAQQARKELDTRFRPQLAKNIPGVDKYDVIFVGYPIWWGTMPTVFFTFFEKYNFSGKTIIPFCTHQGSGFGRSITDIQSLAPNAKVLKGLALYGGNVDGIKSESAKRDIAKWLQKLKVTP